MKKQFLRAVPLLIIGLSNTIGANAQQNTVSSGGIASGSGGTVTYSMGQVAFISSTGSNGNVNQGVQQPYEIYSLGINESVFSFDLSVFPNPTTDVLNLTIKNFNGENLSYQLVDFNGKIIQTAVIKNELTSINLSELPMASYFINLLENNQKVQSFKIIKN
jgi:hypothetical protein